MRNMSSNEITESLLKKLEQIRNEENFKDINELIENLLILRDKIKIKNASKNLGSATASNKRTKTKKSIIIKNLKKKFDREIEKFGTGIVGLSDNWDNQGSKGFDIDTWQRTISLLRKILFILWDNMVEIPIPTILPSPDGSFDINWENNAFELLINIPADIQEPVSLYGEKIGQKEYEIEVRIKFELVESVIIEWLKMIH